MASQTNQSKNLAFSFTKSTQAVVSQQQSSCCTDLPSELDSGSLISYTSLKDLIPSVKGSKNNPYSKGLTIQSAYEIPITNLLVKKAAWVYLQPMPALPLEGTTPREHTLCLVWVDVNSPVKACFSFIQRNIINKIASAFEKLLEEIHIGRNNRLGSN